MTFDPKGQDKPRLTIVDGSDRPVITEPFFARLTGMFTTLYRHTTTPGLVLQRHLLLTLVPDYTDLLFLDDDHVVIKNPLQAFIDFKKGSNLAGGQKPKALFGTSVDLYNDRGFKDYAFFRDDVPWDDHSFTKGDDSGVVIHPPLRTFSANAGHMLTNAGMARELYERFLARTELAGVVDDAVARELASPPRLHRDLQAIHIGNLNNNWSNTGPTKLEAVSAVHKQLVEKRDDPSTPKAK